MKKKLKVFFIFIIISIVLFIYYLKTAKKVDNKFETDTKIKLNKDHKKNNENSDKELEIKNKKSKNSNDIYKESVNASKKGDIFIKTEETIDIFLNSGKASFLVLSSDNCYYCTLYEPRIYDALNDYGEDINIRINKLELNFDFSQNFLVSGTPNSIVFDKFGKPFKFSKKLKDKLGPNIIELKDEKNNIKQVAILGDIPKNLLIEVLDEVKKDGK